MTSGLQPSDLIIVAGRPSMGKTAFAMNIAENTAMRDGKTIAVFSLEMAKEALFTRMLCSHAKINSHRLRTGTLWRDETPKVLSAMEELVQTPIYIDDSPGISLSEMRARRSLHHECTRFRRWWYSGDRPQILEPFLKTQQLPSQR
jgi:replicative DNA helicase